MRPDLKNPETAAQMSEDVQMQDMTLNELHEFVTKLYDERNNAQNKIDILQHEITLVQREVDGLSTRAARAKRMYEKAAGWTAD